MSSCVGPTKNITSYLLRVEKGYEMEEIVDTIRGRCNLITIVKNIQYHNIKPMQSVDFLITFLFTRDSLKKKTLRQK